MPTLTKMASLKDQKTTTSQANKVVRDQLEWYTLPKGEAPQYSSWTEVDEPVHLALQRLAKATEE